MNLEDFVINHERDIRLGTFFGLLAVMAVWEQVSPRRQLTASKTLRWVNNIALVFLNTLILRLAFPAAAVGVAIYVQEHHWGLLNHLPLPAVLSVLVAIVLLDLTIYLQHVIVHHVPILWKLHRVHHADPDIDVTTGSRFHPLEIILSMLVKFATIIVFGVPIFAVVVFEVLLNATAMFNHSNVRIPKRLDEIIRLFIVTPDMHRVHHSVAIDETNSNFGFNLSCWDRVFGTYRDQPRSGHRGMKIGIPQFHQPRQISWLPGILMMPFQRPQR